MKKGFVPLVMKKWLVMVQQWSKHSRNMKQSGQTDSQLFAEIHCIIIKAYYNKSPRILFELSLFLLWNILKLLLN